MSKKSITFARFCVIWFENNTSKMRKRDYIFGIVTILLVVGLLVMLIYNMCHIISERHTVQLNGVSISYLVKGRVQGKPVLLLHGNGGSHEDLKVMTDQLAAAGYLVWAPDSRGQGANPPLNEYHYIDMAEDMHQFVEQVIAPYYGPSQSPAIAFYRRVTQFATSVISGNGKTNTEHFQPVVFGWSDGGIIALQTEVKYPGTWAALVTSGANIDPDCGAWDLAEQRAHPADTSALYQMMLYEPNMTAEDMRHIQCPALIVAGENDLISREHTHLIGDNIPQGEVLIVPHADHGSHIFNNPEMGNIMLGYLNQINY